MPQAKQRVGEYVLDESVGQCPYAEVWRGHHHLWTDQAALIKIFPANILGPEFVSSIRELFQGQLFIPTGGVELNKANIHSWFKAGVCAVGMGSRLISKDILLNEQYELLYQHTVTALELVRVVREEL